MKGPTEPNIRKTALRGVRFQESQTVLPPLSLSSSPGHGESVRPPAIRPPKFHGVFRGCESLHVIRGFLYIFSACSFWGLDQWGLDPKGCYKTKFIKSHQNSSKVIKSHQKLSEFIKSYQKFKIRN